MMTSPLLASKHLCEREAVHMEVYENRLIPDVRHAESAIVWLRILSSLAWLDSAFVGKDAKLSPAFLSGVGLTKVVIEKFLHTAIFPWVVDLLHTLVLPHAQLFAVLIAVTDAAIGILLVLGLFTRLGGALAILRAVTNILIAGGAEVDTVGFNWMLIVAGAIAIATCAGRRFGVDRILIARSPSSRLLRILG